MMDWLFGRHEPRIVLGQITGVPWYSLNTERFVTLSLSDLENHEWILGLTKTGKTFAMEGRMLAKAKLGIPWAYLCPSNQSANRLLANLASQGHLQGDGMRRILYIEFEETSGY